MTPVVGYCVQCIGCMKAKTALGRFRLCQNVSLRHVCRAAMNKMAASSRIKLNRLISGVYSSDWPKLLAVSFSEHWDSVMQSVNVTAMYWMPWSLLRRFCGYHRIVFRGFDSTLNNDIVYNLICCVLSLNRFEFHLREFCYFYLIGVWSKQRISCQLFLQQHRHSRFSEILVGQWCTVVFIFVSKSLKVVSVDKVFPIPLLEGGATYGYGVIISNAIGQNFERVLVERLHWWYQLLLLLFQRVLALSLQHLRQAVAVSVSEGWIYDTAVSQGDAMVASHELEMPWDVAQIDYSLSVFDPNYLDLFFWSFPRCFKICCRWVLVRWIGN